VSEIAECEPLEVHCEIPEWHRDAACAEYPERANDWFPERGEDDRPAKAICQRCLVQRECLADALDHGTNLVGIWGGTSGRQRRALLAGGVTADLVRRWGVHAMYGRELQRDEECERERWAIIAEELGIPAERART